VIEAGCICYAVVMVVGDGGYSDLAEVGGCGSLAEVVEVGWCSSAATSNLAEGPATALAGGGFQRCTAILPASHAPC
jgi:hypothetical protein